MPITPKTKKRRRVLLATTGVTAAVGAGAIAVSDEAKHYAAAIQRSGRVITTLAICVNEFVLAPTPIKNV
jgi:aarF domain-containing kinase